VTGWSVVQRSPAKKPPVWGGQGPCKECRATNEWGYKHFRIIFFQWKSVVWLAIILVMSWTWRSLISYRLSASLIPMTSLITPVFTLVVSSSWSLIYIGFGELDTESVWDGRPVCTETSEFLRYRVWSWELPCTSKRFEKFEGVKLQTRKVPLH
jgi:hypothetical protein